MLTTALNGTIFMSKNYSDTFNLFMVYILKGEHAKAMHKTLLDLTKAVFRKRASDDYNRFQFDEPQPSTSSAEPSGESFFKLG